MEDCLLNAPGQADLDISLPKDSLVADNTRGVLSDKQLDDLLTVFQTAAPNGYLRHCDVANILAEQQAADGASGWTELDIKKVREGLRCFECPATGSVNWRQVLMSFLIAKHGILWDTTPDMMAASAKVRISHFESCGFICQLRYVVVSPNNGRLQTRDPHRTNQIRCLKL